VRIVMVINCVGCGGAERVLSALANAWCERGYEVIVATMDDSVPFYPLAPSIRVLPLKVASESGAAISAVLGNFRRIAALRRCIREVRPDLVVSFMTHTNVLAILAARGCGVRVVACEHTDPRHQKLNFFWSTLRVAVYPFADAVTFLTSNVLKRWNSWLKGKAQLMPNPVSVNAARETVALKHPHNLIAAGRLIELKGFDMLIDAFAAIAGKHKDWGLTILGEGTKRVQLEKQVREAGLAAQVQLPGSVRNAHSWFAQADIYVLTSRYEGLPCALCEAMGCGTPAVSFDCESGPRDIVRDGVDGVLVPPGDVPALAAALDELMNDEERRERLGSRAAEIQQRFGMPLTLERWERLFASLKVADS